MTKINRRTGEKKKKEVKYHLLVMANNFLSAFGLFLTIVIFTLFFILYQWKNVKIRNYLDEIDQLRQEVLEVNAQVSALEKTRNRLILDVPERAEKELGMITPNMPPKVIYVSQKQYEKYDRTE
jgi:hypothetical protein